MNDSIQHLIEAVQKASPVIWQAAYRQVWIEAFEYFCRAMFFLALLILYLRRGKKALISFMDPRDKEECMLTSAISYGISLLLAGAAFGLSLAILERLINPTFAAIEKLKGLL